MQNMVTTRFLAEYFGVSRQAVANWRKEEGFPFVQYSDRIIFYDIAAVEKYFKNKRKK